MHKQLEIMLEGEGLVVFDPYVLADFVQQHELTDTNLFQYFLDNPKVGNEAIAKGVILPMYNVAPIDYQVIFNDSLESAVESDWIRFTTPAFPLTISSGKVVVADVYSVMEWDADFFQQMPLDGPQAPQVATHWDADSYSVTINGFNERNHTGEGPENIGYEFCLQKVAVLPAAPTDINMEGFDFILSEPGE